MPKYALPIEAEVVEAAYELLSMREPDREDVEAAIRAALDKLGLRPVFQGPVAGFEDEHPALVRYVSDWRPVKEDLSKR